MGEIVRFPVLTPGDLQGDNAGIAALYRKLPENPSAELLALAITALLDYYSFLVTTNDQWIYGCDDQIEQAKERLDELRALMAAWHRRQWPGNAASRAGLRTELPRERTRSTPCPSLARAGPS